jgi:hypothetical protein
MWKYFVLNRIKGPQLVLGLGVIMDYINQF